MKVNLTLPPDCVLEDYKISALQLVTKPRVAGPKSLDVECQFCPQKDDKEKYVVKLNINYLAKARKTFSLRIFVNGYFRWRGGYEQKEGNGFLAWVNGGTILYGLVRATVAELTSSSECGRVVLPTVMMAEIVRNQIQEAQSKKAKSVETQPEKKTKG
jgi:preprotein translocase subunit SecB